MKDYIKTAVGLFGHVALATFANILLVISLLVICIGIFTKNIGYDATVLDKDGKEVTHYTYVQEDGKEDTQLQKYEKDGYAVQKVNKRSELKGSGLLFCGIITQTFTLVLLTAFIYPKLWRIGAKDSNAVHFGRKPENVLYGLKVGLLASVPGVLILIAFLLFGGNVPVSAYAFTNASFYTVITSFIKAGVRFSQISVLKKVLLFLPLLYVPAVSEAAYLLGYKDISLSEKLVYKNKKE